MYNTQNTTFMSPIPPTRIGAFRPYQWLLLSRTSDLVRNFAALPHYLRWGTAFTQYPWPKIHEFRIVCCNHSFLPSVVFGCAFGRPENSKFSSGEKNIWELQKTVATPKMAKRCPKKTRKRQVPSETRSVVQRARSGINMLEVIPVQNMKSPDLNCSSNTWKIIFSKHSIGRFH